ncbi:ABC transporter substrate-binding protein [Candidatus Pantoea bituminis]|uniref:ABC transporter substrate-binding protein n=1 Tax=Candidatus Pantoea bituminis TaxID=2831036 RepID=UPI001C062F80|nr:ABC transporter substrate-binding protein [Pantoea bituminis]
MINIKARIKTLAVAMGGMTLSIFAQHSESATPQNRLVIAKNLEDIITLDPAEAYENTVSEILNNSYSRLVRRDPKNPEIINGDVASSWKVSGDGKTFTFDIRNDGRFPSGRIITPDDVVYSIQRVVLLNKTPSFLLKTFGWDENNIQQNVFIEGDT